MKRATLLTMLVALLVALTAGVALAKVFDGTNARDVIYGTNKNDFIKAHGGNDTVYGRKGNDDIRGGSGNDVLKGSPGNDLINGEEGQDKIFGNRGADRMFGAKGNDRIRTVGDTQTDFVNCGPGFDRAYVSGDDLIDGVRANTVITTEALSCEVVYVDGVLIPRV